VQYFRQRGLRVGIGGMLALGSSAPVTLAGAVTLNMAEQLALRLVNWVLFGDQRLSLGGSISVLDMRTMVYPYGRPEMAITNMLTAQLARTLGAEFHGHAGLTDAKLPSVEAGYQKALTALPTLLTGGSLWMDAGLLATDEVCSPVQLILDNEFLSALSHFIHPFTMDDDAIGLDMILNAGPGGSYLVEEHTVHYLRQKELWQPKIWSRQMLGAWLDSGRMLDADRAREIALDLLSQPNLGSGLDENQERAVLRLIEKAREAVDSLN
jgi:trimethylamine--corrinoid protein Co-methyltransferase